MARHVLGRFLEFGFAAHSIGDAFEFYRSLGFQSVAVGDILDHPYAVISDGAICIGLHERELDDSSLTFVRPDLRDYLRALRRQRVELEFSRLAEDQFNEAGFRDPNAQLITLMEAQTFSPGSWEDQTHSVCGEFLEYSQVTRSRAESEAFWQKLGFTTVGEGEEPHPWVRLTGYGITLGFHESVPFPPGLTFRATDIAARSEYMKAKGLDVRSGAPIEKSRAGSATLKAPNQTAFYLLETDLIRT